MSKFFKSKSKQKPPELPSPRLLEEIQKEYQEVLAKAAQSQYVVFVHKKELERLNLRLMEINQEASSRQALDAANQPKPEEKQ